MSKTSAILQTIDHPCKLWLVALTLSIALVLAPAPLSAADDAIEQTIESQILAFQADDAISAYSFAAPSIKSIFPTPDIFMRMVKQGYQPVYRPQSFQFAEREVIGDQTVQFVDLIGPKGGAWRAMYSLQQQADGTWKITGVQLQKGNDAAV